MKLSNPEDSKEILEYIERTSPNLKLNDDTHAPVILYKIITSAINTVHFQGIAYINTEDGIKDLPSNLSIDFDIKTLSRDKGVISELGYDVIGEDIIECGHMGRPGEKLYYLLNTLIDENFHLTLTGEILVEYSMANHTLSVPKLLSEPNRIKSVITNKLKSDTGVLATLINTHSKGGM